MRSRKSAMAVILAFIAAVPVVAALAISPAHAATSACQPYIMVSLRGNAQMFSANSRAGQIGEEAEAIFKSLSAVSPFKGKLGFTGVPDYKPVASAYGFGYIAELNKAGGTLSNFLPSYDAVLRCKVAPKYIVVGYSQGAYEVRRGLQQMKAKKSLAALNARIKAVVLLGDPAQKTTGLLRVNTTKSTATDKLNLLSYSVDTCIQIDGKSWPFPECSVPTTANHLVYDLVSNWVSLGKASLAPLPTQPTYSYTLPGDGISNAQTVIVDQYLPGTRAAKAIFDSNQVSKYTKTVNALKDAYAILEAGKVAHGKYATTAAMPSAITSWLVKTVK